MVTSSAEFDHQDPSSGFGPTAKAPATGDNFQVPTIPGPSPPPVVSGGRGSRT